ncbi:MAG: hypothetical protein IJ428_00995 [Clostridia bacterium]|nr:hypothetical protein [Clostridia bacterium]
MIYLLFGVGAVCTAVSNSFIKLYRRRIADERVKDNLYYILMIIVALIFFGFLSGFDLRVNIKTLLFSTVYALVAYTTVTLNMRAIEHADLVTVSIFSNSGGVLWNTLWGLVLFGEAFTVGRIVGVAAILAAIFIPYLLEAKKGMGSMRGIFYCMGIFIFSGCGQLVVKLYSLAENVMSNSVFCFYTNIILIPFVFLILKRRSDIGAVVKDILRVDKKSLVFLSLALLLANVVTILSMFIVERVDLIIYTVAEKSLTIISTAVVSGILFRERFTAMKLTSIIFLMVAVIASFT